jgi:hypothetical protein
MAADPCTEYLSGLGEEVRSTAERLVAVVRSHAEFDVAIKWRQLTFAVEKDFDHWVCAVAATAGQARLAFHFGAWLDDPTGLFEPSDARFVRKIGFRPGSDVDEGPLRDMLTRALLELPRFRATH